MPLVVYSVERLALFAAALVGLYWLHLGGWLLVVLAALIAWALSYVLLARSRDAAALWLHDVIEGRRRGRFARGLDADAAAEDAEASEAVGGPGAGSAGDADRRRDAGGRGDAGGLEGQAEPEEDAVGELEQPGAGEDRPQEGTAGAEQHRRGQQTHGQGEQQHEQ